MLRSLVKYLCLLCLLSPLSGHADGGELFEALTGAEALADNAMHALPDQPRDPVALARTALRKALRKLDKALRACPENSTKAKRRLLAGARRLAQFHESVGAIQLQTGSDEALAALQRQAGTAIRALQDLASSALICDDGRVLQAADAVFIQLAPFVAMADAWGERDVGAHGTLGVFPGRAASPPHIHTHGYYGVVLRGEMANPFGIESDPLVLPAGSFWYVPPGEQHVTECVSEQVCSFYFHSARAFDFTPIDALSDERSADALSIPADEMIFEPISPFAAFSTVWGDRDHGAHGTFGLFTANSESPPHTHSTAYHGVVIAGTMTNPFNGDTDPPLIESGGYWFVPAGVEHVTACVSDEPCLFYFHAEEAFDFLPAGD